LYVLAAQPKNNFGRNEPRFSNVFNRGVHSGDQHQLSAFQTWSASQIHAACRQLAATSGCDLLRALVDRGRKPEPPVEAGSHFMDGSGFMKKFMALYMANAAEFEKMMRNATPEQQQKGMQAWMSWMNANKASLVDGGAPLGKTKRADAAGVSDTRNGIGGYSIVQAESHEAATKLFGKDHPHLQMPGAWVEVLEVIQLPGM
jgi:hypothetical protein